MCVDLRRAEVFHQGHVVVGLVLNERCLLTDHKRNTAEDLRKESFVVSPYIADSPKLQPWIPNSDYLVHKNYPQRGPCNFPHIQKSYQREHTQKMGGTPAVQQN